jgi:uncharacterized delta-60 repeat protein
VDSLAAVGLHASLLEVEGQPALVYVDTARGSVEYRRATGTGPDRRWPVDMDVQTEGFASIPDGGTVEFGVVAVGTISPMNLRLQNPNTGSGDLTISGLSLDGPDAAEFSIAVLPEVSVLAGGAATLITVAYAPFTPGIKRAVLHITTGLEGPKHIYDITLTASSIPDIEVRGFPNITDGIVISLPLTVPGTVADLHFLIRNPGGAELDGLAITIGGPDRDEFSLISAPVAPVPPGGRTSFTVRHAPATAGFKTASLHIASNVAGSKNPFDITLRMAPGSPDDSFIPSVPTCTGVAVQPDGKILAGGFGWVGRFDVDGGADSTFFPPSVTGGSVLHIAVQPDGKILIGGFFEAVSGMSRPGLARLEPDGTLDPSFDPRIDRGSVRGILLQPDGKIVIGRDVTTPDNSPPPDKLLRLNADGTLDPEFHSGHRSEVNSLTLQPDGKILIGGRFEGVSPAGPNGIARFLPDGTRDLLIPGFDYRIYAVSVQADGKILVGGNFTEGLVRFFPNGSRDPSLNLGFHGALIYDLAVQADGKCIAGGTFGPVAGVTRHHIFRLHPDGSLDLGFDPEVVRSGLYEDVYQLAVQADGKVLIAGNYAMAGGHTDLTRVNNDAASDLLQTEDRSAVRWLRSGSVPEVTHVSFEVKPFGEPGWTLLGTGTRIPGGWELTGLTLPASGSLRARGRAEGSLIESVIPLQSSLDAWRLQYFNTSASIGDAADDADPDHDGLTNFTEFAFGLSPVDRTSHALPEFKYDGISFTSTFSAPEGPENVIYGAEWSASMLPGTWTALPDTGAGGTHEFSVDGSGQKIFVRYRVQIR